MCFQNSLKKIITFSAAFLVGIFSVVTYQILNPNTEIKKLSADKNFQKSANSPSGFSGAGESGADKRLNCLNSCRVCKCEADLSSERPKNSENEFIDSSNSTALKILYKPKPKYTQEARSNNVQGSVRLRVTFLKNGKIGAVSEIAGLPFGLTEKAIEAAKKMKFEPQTQNGESITVTKVVGFTFTIY